MQCSRSFTAQLKINIRHQPVSRSAQVKIWDLKTGRELRSITTSGEIPMEAEFSTDGRSIAVIGGLGQLLALGCSVRRKLRDL